MALLFAVAFGLVINGLSSVARGQEQPNVSPEQQQLQDQMQQNRQTIFENMRAKGVDPRQFFQQFQQGADWADIQKQMIDQGILDPQLAAQMQETQQKLTNLTLRDQLQCSDAEWAIMQPLIQKVMAAQNAVGEAGFGAMMRLGGFSTGAPSAAGAEVSKAKKALRAAIADANTTADQFAKVLGDLRDARAQAKAELEAARRDLVGVLNTRQEAALTNMGVLE
jgi:hypothetical protein